MEISLENIKYLELVKDAQSVSELEQIRIKLLGKKGEISNLLRSLGQMESKERQIKSPEYNNLKQSLEEAIKERRGNLLNKEIEGRMNAEWLDTVSYTHLTLPTSHLV